MIYKGLKLILGFFIIALITESCGCGEVEPYYNRQELHYEHFTETNIDELRDLSIRNTTDSINVDSGMIYGLTFRFDVNYHSMNQSYSFFDKTYAKKCLYDGHEGTENPLTDFTITSTQDFNDNYPAQSDLTELFLISTNGNEHLTAQYMIDRSFSESTPSIYLQERPTISQNHQFIITFFEENNQYQIITQNVTFN